MERKIIYIAEDLCGGCGQCAAVCTEEANQNAILTRLINTRTSTSGPITATNACPELTQNIETGMAIFITSNGT
ncbi:MAG: hypothetical protein ACD_21C00261G0008 [uncultured bacterium]|nr:MAG: hypothetical protein ACD_21C00261G0008 [uncultured bacterium]